MGTEQIKEQVEFVDVVNALEDLLIGLDMIKNPVAATLGRRGRLVSWLNGNQMTSSKDGASIAKEVSSVDPIRNYAINLVKNTAFSVDNDAGDGTTSSTIIASMLLRGIFDGIADATLSDRIVFKQTLEKYIDSVKSIIKNKFVHPYDREQIRQIINVVLNNDSIATELLMQQMELQEQGTHVTLNYSISDADSSLKTESYYAIQGGCPVKAIMQRGKVKFEDCAAIFVAYDISSHADFEPIRINIIPKIGNKPLMLFVKSISGESLALLNQYNSQTVSNDKKNIIIPIFIHTDADIQSYFIDIAAMCNCVPFSLQTGFVLKSHVKQLSNGIGQLSDIIITERDVYVDAEPNELVNNRIIELRDGLVNDENNVSLRRRIGALSKNLASITYRKSTEIAMQEFTHRLIDAESTLIKIMKNNTGYLCGAGIPLSLAANLSKELISDNTDIDSVVNKTCQILTSAFNEPFKILLNQSYTDGIKLQSTIGFENGDVVFDSETKKIGNFVELGIMDSEFTVMTIIEKIKSLALMAIDIAFIKVTR